MNLNQIVTDAVRLAMAHENMSRGKLAEAMGFKSTKITYRMTGHTPWTIADLQALAGIFGIPASLLFAGGPAWIKYMNERDEAVRPTHGRQTKMSA